MRFFRRRNAISFYGTSVVITGGSRGLGLVLARELAAEGANLTIMARDIDAVERAAQDLSERGARVLALRGDVHDQKIAQEAIDRTVAHYGCIEACRVGAPQLIVSPQAKAIVYFSMLFPGLTADAMRMMNRLLPRATNTHGDFAKTGWESQSSLEPSLLTRLADQATQENNGRRRNSPLT